MSQRRLVNFGTPADAAKVKEINRQFFAPQVLAAGDPFFAAAAPDQLVIQPHSAIFNSGIVLVEDEIVSLSITTGFNSVDYTIAYRHVDEDIIGGTAATLEILGGLLQNVTDGVILGWVQYPGGSVPLDDTMLSTAFRGRVVGGRGFKEVIRAPSAGKLVVSDSSYVSSDVANIRLNQVIPTAPYQLTVTGMVVSSLLPDDDQRVRVYNRDDALEMTRVAALPSVGEYSVNGTTDTFTFNAFDVGKVVDLFDMTYGTLLSEWNDSGALIIADRLFSFETSDIPLRNIFVEYLIHNDYTVDVIELLDADGNPGTFEISKSEPSSPDGTVSRMTARILSGNFVGTSGEIVTLRLRTSLGAYGVGALVRVRASTYDLPF